jgi:hypothetical protein
MSTHVAWHSIELLHNVVRTLEHLATLGEPLPTITYRAKVKLHGTNCAVQVAEDRALVAQSRTQILTAGAGDHMGFAAWVAAHADAFAALAPGDVVFGEWCGPGVQKGVAIAKAPEKLFAVFAIVRGGGAAFVVEPAEIAALVPALRVLPWEGEPVAIDFAARASLEAAAAELDRRVGEVEREDPWVKREFGIAGLGEGLVLYPSPFSPALMFKAKGEKHRTQASKSAVTVDPAVASSVAELVALLVTPARMQQGVDAVCGGTRDPKRTGAFLVWVADDVRKESVAELEASGLMWAQVDKAVQAAARTWFLSAR